ncbi:MAG: prolipoprotein diacylglyceryl transferase [Proteobacteria bacterium]|nr:prolipoprotein diacylglyceryl transferase [Pseudomonadota bacterium]
MTFEPILAVLEYHNISPDIFRIGPFALRWYSLSYIAALVFGWWWMARYARKGKTPYNRPQLDDFVFWALVGVFLGGRLGYVLFYNLSDYLDRPLDILKIWEGGMSFHGGLLGVIAAVFFVTRKHKINIYSFSDYLACAVPAGLFFGRVANFINGELYGAPSQLPWAMPFPGGGAVARHPSQLYEAALEGLLLFMVLNFMMTRTGAGKFPGMIVGMFFTGYGISRYLVEFVRLPDAHLGKLWGVISMGQLLSLPMVAFGLYLIVTSLKRGAEAANKA